MVIGYVLSSQMVSIRGLWRVLVNGYVLWLRFMDKASHYTDKTPHEENHLPNLGIISY